MGALEMPELDAPPQGRDGQGPEAASDLSYLSRAFQMIRELTTTTAVIPRSDLDRVAALAELPARLYAALEQAVQDDGMRIEEEDHETGSEDTGWDGDGLTVFIQRARHDVLTAEQEVALAQRIELGALAAQALASVGETLDPPTVRELHHQAEDGSRARDEFAGANLRLVISIAARYRNRGVELDDLIQEGWLGLARAIDKFDYRLGHKFSTYATWWIRQSITRALADKSRTIRIPVHMVETINKVVRYQRLMTQELGHEPTIDELAQRVELLPKTVEDALRLRSQTTSLDRPLQKDLHIADIIADRTVAAPDDAVEQALLHSALLHALADLSERQQEIMRLRYGLDDGCVRTLEEVGRVFGVTRERIRQIEAQTLVKLRHPKRSEALRDYLDG